MKRYLSISIVLIYLLLSCQSIKQKQENNINDFVPIENIAVKTVHDTVLNEENTNSGCVRGAAKPIIQKNDYPNTVFVLQSDSLTGIETVHFDNGDKLIINNCGCEYYVLKFRFETTRFQNDTTNLEYWFRIAGRLMTEMLGGLDAPIDIKKGINYLGIYIDTDRKNNYSNLKLGDEIVFDDEDIRSFVTVDRIEKLLDNKFAVEISFALGPL